MAVALKSRTLVVIGGGVLLAALVGCSAEHPVISLASTKPHVQVLRNDLANRIATPLIEGAADSIDTSIACKSATDDPDGIERAWRSGMVVVFKREVQRDVHITVDVLVAAFRGNGWTVNTTDDPDVVTLTRGVPVTTVTISSVPADPANGMPAQIGLDVVGPCVATAGADSYEVTELEKADSPGQ
jgi:hypothetical protein